MRSLVDLGLGIAIFGVLALAVFHPSPFELTHTLPAFRGSVADALLLAWATSHVSQRLFTDPLHLFDAGIFHPARATLAYGDHMIGQAVIGLPIWFATHNPLLEYNLLLLASYATAGGTMFLYARRAVSAALVPAVAAGLVFAFTPYRFHSPLWLQLLWTPFVPLALLAWLAFVRTRRAGAWLAWVGAWTAHSLMGQYLTLYFAVVMGVLALWGLATAPERADRRLWLGTLAAPLATGLLLAPTLWPYVALRAVQGHVRTVGLDTPASFLLPGPGTVTGAAFGLDGPAQLGPGLVVTALVALGLAVGRRVSPPIGLPARFLWSTHVVGLATVLLLVFVPIRLQQQLPGLDMVRNTNRALFVGLCFGAALVAAAVDWLQRRGPSPRARAAIGLALVAALVLDVGTPPPERRSLPVASELSNAVWFLRDLPDDAVVYEQAQGPEALTRAMYHAIFHRKRLPIGYSGFASPATDYVGHALFRFPEASSLDLLAQLGVGWVWAHPATREASDALVARALAAGRISVAGRFGNDVVFDVRALEPPPPPGPARTLPAGAWRPVANVGADSLPLLTDGDASTEWTAPDTPGTPTTLTIALEDPTVVVGLRAYVRGDQAQGLFLADAATSLDGTHFEPIEARFEPVPLDAFLARPIPTATLVMRFPPRRVRFVRLTNPALAFWRGTWQIGELEVLEEPSR